MNIFTYIDEYARKKKYYLSCDAETVHNLIKGDREYSLKAQYDYTNSEGLADNIEFSVKQYTKNKDIAISIHKNFFAFLKGKTTRSRGGRFPMKFRWSSLFVSLCWNTT